MQSPATPQTTVGSSNPSDSNMGDLGWSQASLNRGSAWGVPGPSSSDGIVVDSQNKDEWPSILGSSGGNGDNASSDGGDDIETASAKSGSVISSSSTPGQGRDNSSARSESPGHSSWGSSLLNASGDASKSWNIQGPSLNTGVWGSGSNSNSSSSGGSILGGSAIAWGAPNNTNQPIGSQLHSGNSNNQGRGWSGSADAPGSGWGTSTSSTVISPSIAPQFDSKGPNTNQLWGGGSGSGGWTAPAPSKTSGSSSSGWGSPTESPLPAVGTELWGDSSGGPGTNWGSQSAGSSMLKEPEQTWSNPSTPGAIGGGWGQTTELKSNEWNNGSTKPLWGSQAPQQPTNQWGSTGDGWGASGTSQSSSDSGGSWAGSNQAPGPVGAQPNVGQPGSWAEAAGKGLPPRQNNEVPPAVLRTKQSTKEELVQQLINNNDGWGKVQIKQDHSWDNIPESPKLQRKVLPPSNPSQDAWNQPNDGTAIWESAKEPSTATGAAFNGPSNPAPAPPPPISKNSNHWGNPDADGGTWDGPPGERNRTSGSQSNQWNSSGPSGGKDSWQDDNKSGQWGAGNTNEWDGGQGAQKSGDQWKKTDDNSWNGGWGGRTELGHWGSESRSGHSSSSSWDGDEGTSGTGWKNQPSAVDDGTQYWGGKGPAVGNKSQPPIGGPGPKPTNWNDNMPISPDENLWAGGQSMDSRPPTQMRSRLLQILINMGFKKEDAQNALITNNMNMDNALAQLASQGRRADPSEAEQRGRQVRPMHSSIEDLRTDPTQIDPSLILGGPTATAQHNLPLAAGQMMGNQLKNPSSLINPSINPALQKQLAQQLQNQKPMNQGQAIRNPQMSQQQQQYQNPIAQLNMAAQLAQSLPPQLLAQASQSHQTKVLVIVQQIVQLQAVQQNLQGQHKMLLQEIKTTNPPPNSLKHQQLDKLSRAITELRLQINGLQQQVQTLAAQPAAPLPKQQQQQQQMVQNPMMAMNPGQQGAGLAALSQQQGLPKDLDLSGLNMSNFNAVQTSRLNQWTKPMQQSHSTPDLQTKITGGVMDANWAMSQAWSNAGIPQHLLDEKAKAALEIEEFVPGKRWTGSNIRSVDDDPHMTPASVNRSFSMGQVSEEQLSAMLAVNKGSSSNSPTGMDPMWSNRGPPVGAKWSSGGGGHGPPGLGGMNRGNAGYNRSMSMPTGPNQQTGHTVANSSNWLALRNLSPQVDNTALETVCRQYGPLAGFHHLSNKGQAIICYQLREDAIKAQKVLHGCNMGNTSLIAEFLSDLDLQRLTTLLGGDNAAGGHYWSTAKAPPPLPAQARAVGEAGPWQGVSSTGGWLRMDDLLPNELLNG